MKDFVTTLVLTPVALLTSACQQAVGSAGSLPEPSAVSSASLFGVWELLNVDGIPVPPKRVSVTFESDGRFTAVVDCNKARGTYSYSGAQLNFHGWEVSEMGCLPPLQQETLIRDALPGDGYQVALSRSELHLSGEHRLVFRRV